MLVHQYTAVLWKKLKPLYTCVQQSVKTEKHYKLQTIYNFFNKLQNNQPVKEGVFDWLKLFKIFSVTLLFRWTVIHS